VTGVRMVVTKARATMAIVSLEHPGRDRSRRSRACTRRPGRPGSRVEPPHRRPDRPQGRGGVAAGRPGRRLGRRRDPRAGRLAGRVGGRRSRGRGGRQGTPERERLRQRHGQATPTDRRGHPVAPPPTANLGRPRVAGVGPRAAGSSSPDPVPVAPAVPLERCCP
jgi:hypothetical protein